MTQERITPLLAIGVLALSAASVSAITISGPLSAAQVQSLTSGASYGPPPNIHFLDAPNTVNSGVTVDLLAGNNPGQNAAGAGALIMLSGDVSSLAGNITFDLAGVGSVSFSAADFFSTAVLGLPNNINGIGNGQVNGIVFPTADHAVLRLDDLGFPLGNNSDIGDVTITSSIDLRVDVFGIAPAVGLTPEHIANNTANSGGLGITGQDVPDSGATAMLLGGATLAMAFFRRK